MSMMDRPSCRITIGEAHYDLINSFDEIKNKVDEAYGDEYATIVVDRWDNRKKMQIRIRDITTVQQMGF